LLLLSFLRHCVLLYDVRNEIEKKESQFFCCFFYWKKRRKVFKPRL